MNTPSVWEKAILTVFEKQGGLVTLRDLYSQVPPLIHNTSSEDTAHTVRAYLRRLKKSKGLIKQIGLSTYALVEAKYSESFYEQVVVEHLNAKDLKSIPKERLHGYVEGMLIELGNLNDYETYTPDRNPTFNGKRLGELVTHQTMPDFTYQTITDKTRTIDVIWFKEGFPIKTFDVENSTDFTKALLRAYQLKSFRTRFFMVADSDKKSIYADRIDTKPFNTIKQDVQFISYQQVYELYQDTATASRLIKNSVILKS
jgi:hypothetical protein